MSLTRRTTKVPRNAPNRCECTGECGRLTGRPRSCADPDLAGRCRSENGQPHPRSARVMELRTRRIPNGDTYWICQDCNNAYERFATPENSPSLFDEGTI